MLDIYVDADACPVKDEIYKVARRHDLRVFVVAARRLRVPLEEKIQAIAAGDRFDASDDWIAAHCGEDDIVVTSDLPLADRCLKRDALVLTPKGVQFDKSSISGALAAREILDTLRQMGEMTGGPPPTTQRDKSNFISELHQLIERCKRWRAPP